MTSHGKTRHTKRLAVHRIVPVHRKKHVWITTTKPGTHAKDNSVPLVVLLRDLLKICENTSEVKKVLRAKLVSIDGRYIQNPAFPVGLMDVVSIKNGDSFIILNRKGKIAAAKTSDPSYKLCRISKKNLIAGGKVQLTLHDGRTLVVPDGKVHSTGDTLKLSIPSAKVIDALKMQKGSNCYIFMGRHAGEIGTLKDIKVFPGITPSNAIITTSSGKDVVTLLEYAFVVDKNFKI